MSCANISANHAERRLLGIPFLPRINTLPLLTAYMMYMNIELRLPQGHVDNHVERVFGLYMAPGSTKRCKTLMALSYRPTYDNLVKKLCSGPLLNVDETGISVRGHGGFVWVLASADDVAYVYTPTREGTTIQGLLKDFTGVLVSDFYTAYDSIPMHSTKMPDSFYPRPERGAAETPLR
jgi:hypothetical protein